MTAQLCCLEQKSFFLFNMFVCLFIYLGYIGSSLLCMGSL